jgi:hypothetical protein
MKVSSDTENSANNKKEPESQEEKIKGSSAI